MPLQNFFQIRESKASYSFPLIAQRLRFPQKSFIKKIQQLYLIQIKVEYTMEQIMVYTLKQARFSQTTCPNK